MASRFPVGGQKRRVTKQLQRKEGKAWGTPLSPKNPQPTRKPCLLFSASWALSGPPSFMLPTSKWVAGFFWKLVRVFLGGDRRHG